jgi:hypothetical protein
VCCLPKLSPLVLVPVLVPVLVLPATHQTPHHPAPSVQRDDCARCCKGETVPHMQHRFYAVDAVTGESRGSADWVACGRFAIR